MTRHQPICNSKYETLQKEQLGGKEFSNECAQSLVQEKGGMVYSVTHTQQFNKSKHLRINTATTHG